MRAGPGLDSVCGGKDVKQVFCLSAPLDCYGQIPFNGYLEVEIGAHVMMTRIARTWL